MALDANSYSSVDDVTAMTRHFLEGGSAYSPTTRPTLEEVEGFIDEVSSNLNDAIAGCGFSVPITAAGPKRSCDGWVRTKAAAMIELTQRSAGFDGEEDSRYAALWNLLNQDPFEWVTKRKEGWAAQGVATGFNESDGLDFTALKKHSERSDPNSDTLEQPMFRRRQFNP